MTKAKSAPRRCNKRKAADALEMSEETEPRKQVRFTQVPKKIQISPVDRWNVTQPPQQSQANPAQQEKTEEFKIQGWMPDKYGKKHPVPRLGVDFAPVRWRACGDRHGEWPEDGQVVSPKTVPSIDQMSAVEYEAYRCWWGSLSLRRESRRT